MHLKKDKDNAEMLDSYNEAIEQKVMPQCASGGGASIALTMPDQAWLDDSDLVDSESNPFYVLGYN